MRKRKFVTILSLLVLCFIITACDKKDNSDYNEVTAAPSATKALLDEQASTKVAVPEYISPVINAGSNFYPNTGVEYGAVIYENDFETFNGNVLDPVNRFKDSIIEASKDVAHTGRESVLVKGRKASDAGSGLRISSANGLDINKLTGCTLRFSVWVYYKDNNDITMPDSMDFIIWNRLHSMGTKEDGTIQYEQALKKTVKKGKWTKLETKIRIKDNIDNEMILIGTADEVVRTDDFFTEYYIDDMKLEITCLTTVNEVSPLSNIDVPNLLRTVFKDEVSAKNVEEGRIQEIGITQANNKLSVTLVASMGDERTNIALFEFKPLSELPGPIRGITSSAKVSQAYLDTYVRFGSGTIDAYEVIDNEGNKRYFGKYNVSTQLFDKRPQAYVIDINDISYDLIHDYNVGTIADFRFDIIPNYTILKPMHEIPLNHIIKFNRTDFNVDKIRISQYQTILYFRFKVESDSTNIIMETKNLWEAFTGFISGTDPNKIFGDSSVKLYVNDNEIKLNFKENNFWPWGTKDSDTISYLIFPGFEYDEAEKIEIHYSDIIIPVDKR